MKISHLVGVIIGAVLLGYFLAQKVQQQPQASSEQLPSPQASSNEFKTITLDNTITIVGGQTIYVPVYSSIYFEDGRRAINLTNVLSIRNTDFKNSLILKSVNYHSSTGKLVTSYVEKPIEIPPLASKNFVVPRTQTEGGTSASFIVEWVAREKVSEPIIEAVMLSTESTQGISWVSPGRVIKTYSTSRE